MNLPTDPIQYASIIAHQLKAPVSVVSTILSTILGEFTGPLTPQQKDMLQRALSRCEESIRTSQRLVSISKAMTNPESFKGTAELSRIIRELQNGFQTKVNQLQIRLDIEILDEPLYARGYEPAIEEVLSELVNNSFKYTPDGGQILLTATKLSDTDQVQISISDSGIGIPEEDLEHIFEPFFRTPAANQSTAPGTGLGLSMARAIINACEGMLKVSKSDMGGAKFTITLPSCPAPDELSDIDRAIEPSMKVLIIGGVAAGPKVAAKLSRLDPNAHITIIEKGKLMSYAGCGLPYYVSGLVNDQNKLMSTPVGEVRNPIFFRKVKHVRVMNQAEAIEIDRTNKKVLVKDLIKGDETWLDYDKLVLATGGKPVIPEIRGVDKDNIFTLHGVSDAEGIRANLEQSTARDVIIVGGGLIGIEMTEAFLRKGCRVTIIETACQILPSFDWEIAVQMEKYLQSKGVKILLNTTVTEFLGDDKVHNVSLHDERRLPADLVILSAGVMPETFLARKAGLDTGETGGIKVNKNMVTSDPDIHAVGDCVESSELLSGQPIYAPMGSTANKHGRIVGVNLFGGQEEFPGVLGTTVCRVFDFNMGKTGLTEKKAKALSYDYITVLCPGPDREHFVQEAQTIMIKLVVDKNTRRLLGMQAVGVGNIDKRIDIAATAITGSMTVDQLSNIDLGYSPPFSPVLDNVITACNVARNKLDGHMTGITPMDVQAKISSGSDNFTLLDVRTPSEHRRQRLKNSILIPLGSLRSRIYELDRSREIITFCNYSLRGYEAAIVLKQSGFKNVKVMDGGLTMWPYELDYST